MPAGHSQTNHLVLETGRSLVLPPGVESGMVVTLDKLVVVAALVVLVVVAAMDLVVTLVAVVLVVVAGCSSR